jgi:protein-S-isoprenylcysteine O-methyltransferase Ste14
MGLSSASGPPDDRRREDPALAKSASDHPDVKIAGPVLALLHILAALGLDWLLPAGEPDRLLRLTGLALTLGGVILGLLGVRFLLAANTTTDPHGTPTAIVTDGPYAFSRNPIYLGYVLTVMGLPLALSNYWGLILTPVFLVLSNLLIIRHEEAYLGRKFGDAYAAYRSRVRRWF